MKYIISLLLLITIAFNTYCQKRQSDSARLLQIKYIQKKMDDERKKKEEVARKANASAFNIVSYDSKGNKIETYKSNDGHRVTATTIKLPSALNRAFNPDTIDKDSVTIKVIKSKFRMNVYYKGKILTIYKTVFGPYHLLQKQKEGDRRTPEGTFTILDCRKHDKWDMFMLLDYPNEQSYQNFEKCKLSGEISATSRIGGSVGIHGIWSNGDNVIDLKHNWTDGCVALKNKDVQQLAKIVKPGVTKITIVR